MGKIICVESRAVNSFNVVCNIPSKDTSMKMAKIGGRNM